MHIWTILLASGQGTRLFGGQNKKQFLIWREFPLYWHSLLAFAAVPSIQGLVLTLPEDEFTPRQDQLNALSRDQGLGLTVVCTRGGASRQRSVARALAQVPGDCSHVLVHDAARPFLQPQLIQRIIQELQTGAGAAVPALPVTDTVKQVTTEGQVHTLERDRLFAVQTPQGFQRRLISSAHARAAEQGLEGTDDASLLEHMGHEVSLVSGDEANIKITTSKDLKALDQSREKQKTPCTGWGYDVHRFGPGRPLKLGGIPLSNGPEVEAHSDGDVLIHALIDAILGCLGQGDIGDHFPDSDPAYANANSGMLLAEVLHLAEKHGLSLEHVDMTVITQIPPISPWKEQIRRNLQGLLGLEPDRINLKATTEEKMGFTGHKQGIKAVAQVIGYKLRT